MTWWHSRYWYIPIALVIGAGYAAGALLWIKFGFPAAERAAVAAEFERFLTLFALGLIGGSMHCSVFFAKDANKRMYGTQRLPTVFDVFGYALQIVGGGFTGIMLYLAFEAGLVVMLAGDSKVEVSKYAAWLIAMAGGFGTHYVKQFVARFVAGATKRDEKQDGTKVSDDIYKDQPKAEATAEAPVGRKGRDESAAGG